MKSQKPAVFEQLFRKRWNSRSKKLVNPMVTIKDVLDAMRAFNATAAKTLSEKNPANFLKDYLRNRATANEQWPEFIREAGYTARQETGKGNSFEFVPIAEGQTEAFPTDDALIISPDMPQHQIESVSMPIPSRRMGRTDETWLIQVLVRQRVLETHFALFSPHNVIQLDHLQTGVKLYRTEIDALFLATIAPETEEGGPRKALLESSKFEECLVTCEAKGRDDIIPEQVLQQVRAAFKFPGMLQNIVIPVAVKAIGRSKVAIAEFEAVHRDSVESTTGLIVSKVIIYVLTPPVPGIGKSVRPAKKSSSES